LGVLSKKEKKGQAKAVEVGVGGRWKELHDRNWPLLGIEEVCQKLKGRGGLGFSKWWPSQGAYEVSRSGGWGERKELPTGGVGPFDIGVSVKPYQIGCSLEIKMG